MAAYITIMKLMNRTILKTIGLPMLLLIMLLGGMAALSVFSVSLFNSHTEFPTTATGPASTELHVTAPEEQPQAAETFAGHTRLERSPHRSNSSWHQRFSDTSGSGKPPRLQSRSSAVAVVVETPQLRCQWKCFRNYAQDYGIPAYLKEFLKDHHIVRAGPYSRCA